MYIYEKENKLNIVFNGDKPVESPDVVISKDGETVSVVVAGEAAILPTITAEDKGKFLTVDTETGKAVWANLPVSDLGSVEAPVDNGSV